MKEIIIACILFLISSGVFVMSILSFMQKGFLLNNAYIYASKEERKKLDKKPHYRQSAIVFLLLGIVFLLLGTNISRYFTSETENANCLNGQKLVNGVPLATQIWTRA